MRYFPCMGDSGQSDQGVLIAQCANEKDSRFKPTSLKENSSTCRMSDMGYVSNINGVLVCDPSISFDNEEPTDGTDLPKT